MNVATLISVKEAARRTVNRRNGGVGVLPRYIQSEIKRYFDSKGEKGLKAELITPVAGNPYYVIEEQDFLEWEERRGRSAPGE